MEVGKAYYVIAHAYYHYIGIVDVVVGPKTVRLRNVIQIHSSQKSWSEFFKTGIGKNSRYDVVPDGTEVTSVVSYPWKHEIPK